MHRLIWLCLILAACAAPSPKSFRNTAQQIYSTATLPSSRLIGRWQQEAGFGARCAQPVQGAEFAVQAKMVVVAYQLCVNGQIRQGQGALTGGQGRYGFPGLDVPIWVLWIDEGNRSMALGTPSGSMGIILSKDAIPADRLRAAREILAWNGYDLAQINMQP